MSTGSAPARLRVLELAKLIVEPSSAKKICLVAASCTLGRRDLERFGHPRRQVGAA